MTSHASGTVSATAGSGLLDGLRSQLAAKRPELKIHRFADFAQPLGAAGTSARAQAGAFGEVKVCQLRNTGALVAVKELPVRVDSLDPDSIRECCLRHVVLGAESCAVSSSLAWCALSHLCLAG